MKISIIIPAYNEEERMKKSKILDLYSDYFNKLVKEKKLQDYEILIVINNTTDNTEDLVKQYQKKNKRIRYLNFKQGGKGFAVLEGFKDALKRPNTHIGFVDADLATAPESFYKLAQDIGNADGAIANRYLKESTLVPPLNFRRAVMGQGFNFVVRSLFFFPFTDTQCGAKLFTNKATQILVKETKLSQWAFDVELLYHLNKRNMKVKQVSTYWTEIEGTKIGFLTPMRMFLAVLQLRITHSSFKRLLKPLKPLVTMLYKIIR